MINVFVLFSHASKRAKFFQTWFKSIVHWISHLMIFAYKSKFVLTAESWIFTIGEYRTLCIILFNQAQVSQYFLSKKLFFRYISVLLKRSEKSQYVWLCSQSWVKHTRIKSLPIHSSVLSFVSFFLFISLSFSSLFSFLFVYLERQENP